MCEHLMLCPVSPDDYIDVSEILSFGECETGKCVDVTIVDDEIVE